MHHPVLLLEAKTVRKKLKKINLLFLDIPNTLNMPVKSQKIFRGIEKSFEPKNEKEMKLKVICEF